MTITSTNYTKAKSGFIEAGSGTGLAVTSNSNMTPSIAAGNCWLGGKRIIYAGGTTTIPTADAALGRIDIIYINSNGTIFSKQGTPAATPTAPLIPDNVIALARLTITANDTNIATADIFDLRDFGGFSVDGTTITASAAGVLSSTSNRRNLPFTIIQSATGTVTGTVSGQLGNDMASGGVTGQMSVYLPDVLSVIDGAIYLVETIAGGASRTATCASTIDGADSQSTAFSSITTTTSLQKIDISSHLTKHTWSGVRGKLFKMTVTMTGNANAVGFGCGGMNVTIGNN